MYRDWLESYNFILKLLTLTEINSQMLQTVKKLFMSKLVQNELCLKKNHSANVNV